MNLNIEKLESLRNAYGENVRDFADRIKITHAAYYFFKNKERTPTLETIAKIGEALGINPKDLII